MAEYLSTAELGKYLKLNQKKVYAMVAAGELPAVRISGKWLFPKELVDQWLRERTIQPASGLMGALLDQLLVVQGSDDWLLARILEHVQRHFPVSAAAVGSGAGLDAVARGRAHVAPYHLAAAEAKRHLGAPAYLVDLFERQQGLIVDAARTPGITGLAAASARRLRFATRQPGSGTEQLVVRLARAAGVAPQWVDVGPYASHLEVALAVRNGDADVGVGIEIAAHKTGLAFVPLHTETFALAVPTPFFSHPRVAQFLELAFDAARAHATRGLPGYTLAALGRLQPTS
jgi:excisionase family DNA binding protein